MFNTDIAGWYISEGGPVFVLRTGSLWFYRDRHRATARASQLAFLGGLAQEEGPQLLADENLNLTQLMVHSLLSSIYMAL